MDGLREAGLFIPGFSEASHEHQAEVFAYLLWLV
jgi:hypothetical protein